MVNHGEPPPNFTSDATEDRQERRRILGHFQRPTARAVLGLPRVAEAEISMGFSMGIDRDFIGFYRDSIGIYREL